VDGSAEISGLGDKRGEVLYIGRPMIPEAAPRAFESMSERKQSPVPEFWLRAADLATSSPDSMEAVTALLAEAVGAVEADAGAIVERPGAPPHVLFGCGPEEMDPMLAEGGVIRQALHRQDEWMAGVLPLSRGDSDPAWSRSFEHLLLVPLRARGLPIGAMALLYRGHASPSPDDGDRATVLAGLVALMLENERLYEEARSAHQARDHFLTALNHEMRTPATAFILTSDLIRSATENLPPRVDRLLEDAESQVAMLVDVLRRVLDLGSLGSRADSDRTDIVQPRQVVADLMRRQEPIAKRKNLALALYTPRDLPTLQTDANRFARIVTHLLSNAIKYTSEGRVEVRLERTSHKLGRPRSEPVLAIRVKDTGRGIPPEELERIFEPFTQVEEGARTDSRSRGLGLGLPLARQLARTLGGDVTVESAPGQGTVASFILPYHRAVGT